MIHIIYMAAGNSRRFGSNKLFYELDGKPMYRHLLDRLAEIKNRYNSCHPLPGNIGLLRMYPRLPCSHKSGQRKRHILHYKGRNYGGAGAEKDRYAGLLHVCSS